MLIEPTALSAPTANRFGAATSAQQPAERSPPHASIGNHLLGRFTAPIKDVCPNGAAPIKDVCPNGADEDHHDFVTACRVTLCADGPNFMGDGKLTKFQDSYQFNSTDEILISLRMVGGDGERVTFLSGTAERVKQQPSEERFVMSTQIHEAFPYLRVGNASEAIEFYKVAFGAVEEFRLSEPSGRVGHAELKFGSYTIMLSHEYPEYGIFGPAPNVSTGLAIHLHVDDVDAVTQRAVSAGAKLTMEPADQFHGERSSKVTDPFGHEWYLGSKIEEVSREEMQRRFAAMFENT